MIIAIEYWKYKKDRLFYGKNIGQEELLSQVRFVEGAYDVNEDNFEAMLCRVYGWSEFLPEDEEEYESICPEYTYDRDIGKLSKNSYV